MNDLTQFERDLEELHIELSDEALRKFSEYYELLTEWNSFMNLTAITDFEEVVKKHFIDSLCFMYAKDSINDVLGKDIFSDEISLIDVGTGAGFPAIPLKMAFPNLKITMLDSLNKRINFLNTVIEKLELKDIQALHGRAEDFAKDHVYRETYDIAVSRAVANMSTLSEYCLPFVKKGGLFIPFKSEKITEELHQAKNAIQILGGSFLTQIDFQLPNSDLNRNLIVIKKEKETAKKYPRKAGLPSKEPLS